MRSGDPAARVAPTSARSLRSLRCASSAAGLARCALPSSIRRLPSPREAICGFLGAEGIDSNAAVPNNAAPLGGVVAALALSRGGGDGRKCLRPSRAEVISAGMRRVAEIVLAPMNSPCSADVALPRVSMTAMPT